MDKKNLAIIAIVAGLALILLGASILLRSSGAPQDAAIITVDGREYATVLLSRPQTVVIRQENGAENVVAVSEKGAVMQSSTCDNQLCVHMGEVTVDNWRFRPNQQFIICLPNRVSVELVVHE